MIGNTNTIDLIVQLPDKVSYRLIMVAEAGEWGLPNAKYLLQEKVNIYLEYALDGQMHKDYPDTKTGQLGIRILYVDEPSADTKLFIDRLAEGIKKEGVLVEVGPVETPGAAKLKGKR